MVKHVMFDMSYMSRWASTPVWVQAREYSDDPAALPPVIGPRVSID